MGCKTKKVLIFLVLLIFILNVTAATDDFNAISYYSNIKLCKGETFQDIISITNTGTSTGVFEIKTDQDWVTVTPGKFFLEPYKTQEVVSIIKPPSKSKTYKLRTLISTDTVSKVLFQKIEVEDCENTRVSIKDNAFSNCPCTPTMYTFKITNTGNFIETYDIMIDIDPSYYTLSTGTVIIKPKETVSVFAYMNLPCDRYGPHEFNFVTDARSSDNTVETPFYLDILESCYDYDLTLGRDIEKKEEMTQPLLFEPYDSGIYDFCEGVDYIIPIEIKNKGEIKNTFYLSSEFKLNAESVEIPGGQRANIVLILEDLEPGKYLEQVTVNSKRGMISVSRSLEINIYDCEYNISKEPSDISLDNMKKGLLILLIIILILLILLLIFHFYRKRRPKEEQQRLIDEEPIITERKSIWEDKKRFLFGIIIILIFLLILIYLLLRYLGFDMIGFISRVFNFSWGLIIQYKIFIIIGLILAVLIILLYLLLPYVVKLIRRRKDMKAEEEKILKEYIKEIKEKPKKKEKKKKLKKGMWVFLLVILLIVLFLISSLCFFTTICENIGLEVVLQNQTNASGDRDTNLTGDIITENSTVYIWNKNKVKKIDLSDYIVNKDDDVLEYMYTPIENITAEISDEGIVTLTPDFNWSGERVINIIIDDNKGGRAISPDIFLYVLDVDENVLDKIENFLKKYVIYFFISLLLSIIVVIILILRINLPKKKKKIIVKRKKR